MVTLYCYVTGVRFEDYQQDFLVDEGFIISRNDDDTWYSNTKKGYYTNEPVGSPCGICGG